MLRSSIWIRLNLRASPGLRGTASSASLGPTGIRTMPDKPEEPLHYPADKARQGEIWQRIVFIAGLAGFVVLALVLGWARYAY